MAATTLYDFTVKDIKNQEFNLKDLEGKVCVNVDGYGPHGLLILWRAGRPFR